MFLIKKRRSAYAHFKSEQLLYQTDKSSHRRRYIKEGNSNIHKKTPVLKSLLNKVAVRKP